jgi:hypothetical protein
MGGWFVDIFVEYLFRAMSRVIRNRGSGSWSIAKANVTSSACPNAVYGCHIAEVYYAYRVNGELYTGVNEKPFISPNSGENYVKQFAPGTEFTVRINPRDPSVSIVREGDQIGLSIASDPKRP